MNPAIRPNPAIRQGPARRGSIRLSALELAACWMSLRLPEPPFLLQLPRPVGTRESQDDVRRRFVVALAGLEPRGLSDGRRPAPALAAMLHTLARAGHQLDIRFSGPNGRPALALGAVNGACGVVVTGGDGAGPIALEPMDASRVPAALLGLLGLVTPGVAAAVNIPGEVFDRARAAAQDGNPWTLCDELIVRGVPRRDATALARVNTDICFGGQLGITTRSADGERRGPWVIGFLRNRENGYFLQVRRNNTVTVSPTDGDRLLRHWRELVNQVVAVAAA
jgi:hypothetical protein